MQQRLARYAVFHFSAAISRSAIDLLQRFGLSHGLELPDALIAATAVILELPLFIYNVKDFHFTPGLQLHEPGQ